MYKVSLQGTQVSQCDTYMQAVLVLDCEGLALVPTCIAKHMHISSILSYNAPVFAQLKMHSRHVYKLSQSQFSPKSVPEILSASPG